MSQNMLSKIRDGNLEELDSFYKKELENYTNIYQQYLERVSGNDDDREAAENELKPQIVEKNQLLITLAQVFLENNQRSAELIEEDYKMIEAKTSQRENLKGSFTNLEQTIGGEKKAEEVKAQKKIENIEGVTGKNKIILTTLTVVNILILTFLVLGIVRLTILQKNL
jgi:hypothetical protein